MPTTIPADRTMSWRENQIKILGRDEFNKQEYRKRKERLERRKAAANANRTEHKEEYKNELQDVIDVLKSEIDKPKLPLPDVRVLIKTKADIGKVRQIENCNDLLEQVFRAKTIYLANLTPPKTIKKESVKQQLDKVKNLHKKMTKTTTDCTDFSFLRDTEAVIEFINKEFKTDDSRNSQIQAIASILQSYAGFDKEYEIFSKYSSIQRKAINQMKGDNLLTPKEKEEMLPWKEIENLHKKIKDPKDKAIVAFYTLQPPRRVEDVGLITIGEHTDTTKNSLLLDSKDKPLSIRYRKFKTDKTYDKITIPLSKKLQDILAKHIEASGLKKGDPLFGTTSKGYYVNFSEIVSKTFKKYTKKNITANLLRHLYISNFLSKKQSGTEKEKLAKLMGNSVAMQAQYDRIDV